MRTRQLIYLGICSAALILSGCGKKEVEPAADGAAAATAAATDAAAPAATSWTPEALEELAAPIALYPDVVLGHVLTASTNPQEVLDAGNWLIENQDLSGSQLDDEASKLGLSPSTRALLQFPEALDMMCMQMDWTTELGQAFTADQGAVLDAVQRLRKQAKDVGNLETSAQLKVDTSTQDGKEVVEVKPANPDVVYVPKYDPEAVYAPPPANIPPPTTVNVSGSGTTTVTSADGTTTTVAPAATTAAATTSGHSTGALITTGLLAFGAGILVNEVFDDDDDWDNYGPNYYHGGMYYGGRPYYPPPPYMYRPPYGNGYYPAHDYNRPGNYQHGFNNNTIIVNNGGNDYWNRQGKGATNVRSRKAQSPITAANPKRNDLDDLNRQASDRSKQNRQAAAGRDAAPGGARQSGYAGAKPENKAARDKMVAKSPPAGVARDLPTRPKTEYKGANNPPTGANRPANADNRSSGANRPPGTRESPQQRPTGSADRGRDRAEAARPSADRPAAAPQAVPKQNDRTAFGSGGGTQKSGKSEHQASQRGKASTGGGGGKARKPHK